MIKILQTDITSAASGQFPSKIFNDTEADLKKRRGNLPMFWLIVHCMFWFLLNHPAYQETHDADDHYEDEIRWP